MQVDDLSSISLEQLLAAGNWQQQYKLIIQWGKLITPKPHIRSPENLIRGCEVPVWLADTRYGEKIVFAVDADSNVIRGLAALILVQVSNKTVMEIAAINIEENLRTMGLEKHLTPSRNNGLHAMIARVKACGTFL